MTSTQLYELHLAEMAIGTPLHSASGRVMNGQASVAELIAAAQWQLTEADFSLDKEPR